ncbi:MAG: hypothetical protein Kow0037_15310 [Calditrichia bacterium]
MNLPSQLFVHIGYALMLLALAVRDFFWLRAIFICAQISLIIYGLEVGSRPVVMWNSLFLAVNSFQLWKLFLQRRPIQLPDEMADLYESVFHNMSRREFLYFWNMGHRANAYNRTLIRQGQKQNQLLLLLKGQVRVEKNGKTIARLGRGSFVAEMSFLTGEPASADVRVDEKIEYMAWQQEKLRHLNQLNPSLYIKLQNILGKDLADKIKAASQTTPGD